MESIVFTPSPYNRESFWGYLIRLAEENGYASPSIFLLPSGFVKCDSLSTHGLPYQNLLQLLNKSETDLYRTAYYSSSEPNTLQFKILDHQLPVSSGHNFLNFRRPRVCPDCILEDGYIDAFWDLEFAFYCPRHNKFPISICKGCGKRVSHLRPELLTCKCRYFFEANEVSTISNLVFEMMQIIWAKLHRLPFTDIQNKSKYELDAIERMSLRSLCKLFVLLPRLKFNHPRSSKKLTFELFTSACEILANWPHNFRTLLQDYGNRRLAELGKNTSLSVCFEKLYNQLFIPGPFADDMDFIKQEYVYFGRNVWEGLKQEPSKNPNKNARYVSGKQFANQCGVSLGTVKKWAKKGLIQLKQFGTGPGSKYFVDLETVNIPDPREQKIIGERNAAKVVGINGEVFKAFIASGHFEVSNKLLQTSYYLLKDLLIFRKKFVDVSELIDPKTELDFEKLMSLDKLFRRYPFFTFDCKAAFLSDYLDGKIKSYGRIGDTIKDVYLEKKVVRQYCQKFKHNLEVEQGIIRHEEAMRLIGTHAGVTRALVRSGVLPMKRSGRKVGMDRKAFFDFVEIYAFLPVLAKEWFTTTPHLTKLCKKLQLSTLDGKTSSGDAYSFIKKSDIPKLIILNEVTPIPALIYKRQQMKLKSMEC